MCQFKVWVGNQENRSLLGIDSDQLTILLNEMDSSVVSIKASGIFPITYGLLVNVSLSNETYWNY